MMKGNRKKAMVVPNPKYGHRERLSKACGNNEATIHQYPNPKRAEFIAKKGSFSIGLQFSG